MITTQVVKDVMAGLAVGLLQAQAPLPQGELELADKDLMVEVLLMIAAAVAVDRVKLEQMECFLIKGQRAGMDFC
jgi:type III secretory pathway component EscS